MVELAASVRSSGTEGEDYKEFITPVMYGASGHMLSLTNHVEIGSRLRDFFGAFEIRSFVKLTLTDENSSRRSLDSKLPLKLVAVTPTFT